jgi:hypothetical protein
LRLKDQNQLLSDTLLIGEYLKIRAKLLTKKTKRDEHLKQSFVLQHQINESRKHLRNTATARKRSGRSHYEEKQLLSYSSINIFELIEAKHLDYKMIDAILASIKNF